MKTIINDLQWRYAVKKFNPDKKLSDEQIVLLKKAFNLTPTSYGLQPIRMKIVSDDKLKAELKPAAFDQIQVTTCSHLLVIAHQTDFGAKDIDRFTALKLAAMPDKKDDIIKNGEILKSRFAVKPKEEIILWAREQAFIALGNLLTVCAVEKIDACPMGGFIPENVNKILGLDKLGLNAAALLPVGYRAADDSHQFEPKIRRPLSEMIIE